MIEISFAGRIGIQQRVLPTYRAAFFDGLAQQTIGGLSVFAGKPLRNENIERADRLQVARLAKARNWYFFDPSSPWFICWQWGFISWLEKWQPDVLVVEANPRYRSTENAIAWMRKKGRPVIGWGLGAPRLSGPWSGVRYKQRQSLIHALDAIIAYSQQGAEQYRQMGIPATRVFVASNAVVPAPARLPPYRLPAFYGKPSVLFVGRLQLRKRVDLLIQACAALPDSIKPNLTIVGDGPAMGELKQLAQKEYPATEFVGSRQEAELEPYYIKADLFVLPGTGGLAIQQAMAHGLPVVVAQGDGTQDDLVRNENGWKVPPGDLQALVTALEQALSDAARLRKMGAGSFRIVAEEINVEKMVEVFIEVANQVSRGKF